MSSFAIFMESSGPLQTLFFALMWLVVTLRYREILLALHVPPRVFVGLVAMIALAAVAAALVLVGVVPLFDHISRSAIGHILLLLAFSFSFWGFTFMHRSVAMQRNLRSAAEDQLKDHQDHLQQLIHQRTQALRQEVSERKALQESLAVYSRAMEKDLRAAARTQSAMQTAVPKVAFAEIAAESFAREQVNGDLYHVMPTSDGAVLLLVGDAMGHGAAAGFMTVLVRTAMKALDDRLSPGALLAELNALMAGQDSGVYVTAVLAKMYPDGRCVVSHAGHPPSCVIRRDGSSEDIGAGGFALGMFTSIVGEYDEDQLQLALGDRLVLYTDGIDEARNGKNEDFGRERLLKVLQANTSVDVETASAHCLEAMYDFCAGMEIVDDVTLLLAEYQGNGASTEA